MPIHSWILILLLPLLGGLIGWLTNWLAIRMLFRPRLPIRVFRWNWQGLIPRRQKEVARQAAAVLEEEILEKHLVRRELERMNFDPYIDELAARLVFESVGPRLRRFPILGSLVNDSILRALHRAAIREMHKEARPLIHKIAAEAEKHFNIRAHVQERVAGFDLDQLERVVRQVAHREFRAIEMMGAIVGLIVGVVQLGLLLISGALVL